MQVLVAPILSALAVAAPLAVRRLMGFPLPGFPFGVDIVLLLGYLHLSLHRTLDEAHHDLLEQLAPVGVSICRREVLSRFDAYCSLLRAVSDVKEDRKSARAGKARKAGSSSPSMGSNRRKATKPSLSGGSPSPVAC